MAHRQPERIVPAPGERKDEELDEGIAAGEVNDVRREDKAAVVGEVEGQSTTSEGNATGEGGASNEHKIVMDEMEVGEEETEGGG